jgi:hypothetical protein
MSLQNALVDSQTLAQAFVSQFGKVRESLSLHSRGMNATYIALAQQPREREGQTA